MTKLEQLIHAISILAINPEKQIEYLSSIGHFENNPIDEVNENWSIDELAIQFDDAAIFLHGLLDRGEITSIQFESIAELINAITDMSNSNDDSIWTLKSLKSGVEWIKIRELAGSSLMMFESGRA